jgi:hypothetical protein
MKQSRDKPSVGMVVRFDYLWKRERDLGKDEGAKVRPCVVVLPLPIGLDGKVKVLLAAITHATPHNAADVLEIPSAVKRSLGLDMLPSWIVVNEVNVADWSDPGFVPASKESWSYGYLPKWLAVKVKDEILQHAKSRTLGSVPRD